MERILSAIRACTQESPEAVGGLPDTLETVPKIFVQRGNEPAEAPAHVEAEVWISTRITELESGA